MTMRMRTRMYARVRGYEGGTAVVRLDGWDTSRQSPPHASPPNPTVTTPPSSHIATAV